MTDEVKIKLFKDKFINLIKDIFPNDANFRIKSDSDGRGCYCCVKWKLNTDKNRKNKTSKIIKIIISEELLEDYENLDDQEKINIKSKFQKFVEDKLAKFDPDHNETLAPIEEWIFKN